MKAHESTPRDGVQPDARDTVAYSTLLNMAHEEGLKSIATQLLMMPNEENGRLAIVKATVETSKGHFEGIGDADPTSVEERFAPHLIRVAETRAKARALRDAVNCGIVSCEELEGVRSDRNSDPGTGAPAASRSPRHTGTSSPPPRPRTNGQARSPRAGNGAADSMTEAQRRYLFRLMAGQGYQREAAEERLKDLFLVDSLNSVTKVKATKLIDELLQASPPKEGSARGARDL